jgi:hypothetical protein
MATPSKAATLACAGLTVVSIAAWGINRLETDGNKLLGWFGVSNNAILGDQSWFNDGNQPNFIEEDAIQIACAVGLLVLSGRTSHPALFRLWAIFILAETGYRIVTGEWAFGLAGR